MHVEKWLRLNDVDSNVFDFLESTHDNPNVRSLPLASDDGKNECNVCGGSGYKLFGKCDMCLGSGKQKS